MLRYVVAACIILVVVIGATWLIVRRNEEPARPRPRRLPSAQKPSVPDSVARGNWLVGVAGEPAGKTFHVGARTVTIGRGVGNFLQITDPDASRVHCRLTPVPGGLLLEDLGSKNGTFVNGDRVERSHLADGDEVAIGETRFRYSKAEQFAVDHGLSDTKVAGAPAKSATMFNDPNLNVATLARRALDETGGDVQAAAQKLGLTPAMLLRLLE